MDKMRMESLDITAQNIEKLAALFPNCVTETVDAEGKTRKAINFEILKQMLSDEVADVDEAYEFTWVGKRAAIIEANRPIKKTLRPCTEKSVNWDSTQNIYIEGDNLEVLKLLQESYLGAVKLIYIDPPYNTGNDFIYRDDFAASVEDYNEQVGMFDEETGDRLFRNTDSNGRFHSDWCSMIYSRLLLARNLLSADGAIFISIDDNEADNLKKICDEVFGADCFVANVSWQRTYSPRNDSKGIVSEIEHLLVYSKQPNWQPQKLPRTEDMDSKYKNPDNDDMPWTSSDAFAADAASHQGMVYAIQHPFTGKMIYPYNGAHWRYQQEAMLAHMSGWARYELRNLNDREKRAEICGVATDVVRAEVMGIVLSDDLSVAQAQAMEVYKRGKWPKFYFTQNGQGGIRRKTYIDSVEGKTPTNLWLYSDVGHTDEAKKEIISLFEGKAPFDTPKPTRLMDRILTIAADEDCLVMDFFSGSASMAHAILAKNAVDKKKRKFILVQLPEKSASPEYDTLCDVGQDRIRRSALKVSADDIDTGFRVFKVDDTNMKDVYYSADEYSQQQLGLFESNIKEDRNDLDLLFGCLLEWGVPLSLPYTSEVVNGCTIHDYNHGDLIACFDENVPESVIKDIAKRKPLRAVFRDASFADSPAKINVFELFKLYAPDTRIKVI